MSAARGLPSRTKPALMRAPWPIWRHLIYPLWLRWYDWHRASRLWKEGSYEAGDLAYWRGVRLVCCLGHFCGGKAEHPWDPGWGWSLVKAAALWEPARGRDRLLLRVIGDPRPTEEDNEPDRVRVPLRLRRGLVWWLRRCIDCRGLHLNGRRVCRPLCVGCARAREEGLIE